MPLADGLFARAIMQSGVAAAVLTPRLGVMMGESLADALGVEPTREAIAAVPLDRLVRTASDLVTEVRTAPDPARWGELAVGLLPFAPVVDGEVLPRMPVEAFADGQGAGVPVLVGSNRDEARLVLVPGGGIVLVDDAALLSTAGAYGLGSEAVAVYRANRPGASPGDVLAAILTDWYYGVPALRLAEARAGATTWVYRFDHPEPEANHGLGACHAVDLPFVFDTIAREDFRPLIGDTPSQAVADTLHGTWVTFITDGDPGWAPYTPHTRTTALLTDEVQVVHDLARGERLLWDGIR